MSEIEFNFLFDHPTEHIPNCRKCRRGHLRAMGYSINGYEPCGLTDCRFEPIESDIKRINSPEETKNEI